MAIGYACLTVGVLGTKIKSCTLKNAEDKRLTALISHNLKALETMLNYNIENRIDLFRISSEIIPFASNTVNTLPWQTLFRNELDSLSEILSASSLRVSMHPGQYTVLNSPISRVVNNAVADLVYHADFLDSIKASSDSKIVLHIGGVYGDKGSAINRFIKAYNLLPVKVKSRLVLENDDTLFNIDDVLRVSDSIDLPVVFDVLHNTVNPSKSGLPVSTLISRCASTWKPKDGKQKIHYSQQAYGKKPGSHSSGIGIDEFLSFYRQLPDKTIDIMLEVKDKNLSALKCVNVLLEKQEINILEKEWSRYKYLVLGKSPQIYNQIRELLKDKNTYPVREFYKLIEAALSLPENRGYEENAARHIAGYFKSLGTDAEKKRLSESIANYRNGTLSLLRMKATLLRLAEKYAVEYLLGSLYFYC